MRCSATLAALGLCLLAASAAHAAPPSFTVTPDTLRADESGTWHANMVLLNPSEWGLYPDSLFMDWVSDDPDSGAIERRGTRSLLPLVRVMAPAGGGESTSLEWSAPADFARGTITFRLFAHDARKTDFALASTLRVTGNTLYDLHPQRLLPVGRRVVEMVVVAAPEGAAPTAGIVYVPPAGVPARSLLRWVQPIAARGFTVALVSLPGAGRSSGPNDRGGPASADAIHVALASLAKEPGVDAKRLALWGVGEGGTAALVAAVAHPELCGVVAQDATFDAWATYRTLGKPERAAYVAAVGSDSVSWRERSPIMVATRITSPVLVLQTHEPGAPDAAPARAFANQRTERNLYIETRLGELEGRPLARRDAQRLATDFLLRRTQPH